MPLYLINIQLNVITGFTVHTQAWFMDKKKPSFAINMYMQYGNTVYIDKDGSTNEQTDRWTDQDWEEKWADVIQKQIITEVFWSES